MLVCFGDTLQLAIQYLNKFSQAFSIWKCLWSSFTQTGLQQYLVCTTIPHFILQTFSYKKETSWEPRLNHRGPTFMIALRLWSTCDSVCWPDLLIRTLKHFLSLKQRAILIRPEMHFGTFLIQYWLACMTSKVTTHFSVLRRPWKSFSAVYPSGFVCFPTFFASYRLTTI